MGALDLGRALGNPMGMKASEKGKGMIAPEIIWIKNLPLGEKTPRPELPDADFFFSDDGKKLFYSYNGLRKITLKTPFDLRSVISYEEIEHGFSERLPSLGGGFFWRASDRGVYKVGGGISYGDFKFGRLSPLATLPPNSYPKRNFLDDEGMLFLEGRNLKKASSPFMGEALSRPLFIEESVSAIPTHDRKYTLVIDSAYPGAELSFYEISGSAYEDIKARRLWKIASLRATQFSWNEGRVHIFIQGKSLYHQRINSQGIFTFELDLEKGLL